MKPKINSKHSPLQGLLKGRLSACNNLSYPPRALPWAFKFQAFSLNTILVLIVFILIISSCIRPHYTPQDVIVPETWRLKADEGSTLCNLKWWSQFGDPVLDELIVIALRNNQDLKVAIARVFEFYNQLGVVSSQLYPVLNGNASYERFQFSLDAPNTTCTPNIPTAGVGVSTPSCQRIFNDYQLFFSLSWELDLWGRVSGATQAVWADWLASIQARRGVVLTLVKSVANAYIMLRTLDSQLEVSKKTLESRVKSLQLAELRFELGETSELEVTQAATELEVAAISMIQFERAIPLQENLLSILLGENPHQVKRGSAIEAFKYPVKIPAGLPSDLLARRPDIVEAKDEIIAANARVTEAQALYFPQIFLTGQYGNESTQLRNLLSSPALMWQWGLSAVEPIFNAGKTVYQVHEAKAIRAETVFKWRQTILGAFREVDDALVVYKKNLELVEEHLRQVKVLIDYVYLATLRYEEGEVDYLNVLDAERSLFDAELALVQAQGESYTAVVNLYSALGGGWVMDADSFAMNFVYQTNCDNEDVSEKSEGEGVSVSESGSGSNATHEDIKDKEIKN